jgi:peptidoglycan/xylan/chitin deacetylase (PgdA/CDA1 family)
VTALALTYHDVVDQGAWDASGFPGPTSASFKLDRRVFERHLAAISGVAAVRGTVFDVRQDGRDRPPVLLTFDDGGLSAYACVAGLLEEFGWRGHFFVTTDRLGTPGFLNAAQLRELAGRGHVIGTHSCSHPLRMSSLRWERMLDEWRRSTAILSDALGAAVRVGSLPGGAYSPRVAAAAAAAGLTALFTSEPTARCRVVAGCVVIGRYAVRRRTPAAVAARIASGDIGPRLWQWCFWNAKKAAKLMGGEAYLALRRLVYQAAAARRPS